MFPAQESDEDKVTDCDNTCYCPNGQGFCVEEHRGHGGLNNQTQAQLQPFVRSRYRVNSEFAQRTRDKRL